MARPFAGTTFRDRVFRHVTINAETGCWEFLGHRDACGYGRIWRDGGLVRIHREIWKDSHGAIPDGMCVCHHCDNPCCVNIEHLFLGTHGDNMRDMLKKGRHRALCGEAQTQAKLKEEDVARIKRRILNGETPWSIAKDYPVSDAALYNIKRGARWRHVLPEKAA